MSDLRWSPAATPAPVARALAALSEEYAFASTDDAACPPAAGDIPLAFREAPRLRVTRGRGDDGADLGYVVEAPNTAAALRGAGFALAGVAIDGEASPFASFGVMLDCSRNAVPTPEFVRAQLRRLALLGFNQLMLYAEDVYTLPGEPHFGHLRGAYALEDIQALDDYADTLGIELVGCIQTLGHMERFIARRGGDPVRDTESVLLVDADATYALIGKMLDFWQRALRSKRIHLGMDETHDLGRGVFMDRHGHERGFDLFNRHLARVKALADARGFEPMIWSDMYFRMASKTQEYYDPRAAIPDDVRDAIPEGVRLVYWDYYNQSTAHYRDMIDTHRKLVPRPPVMASGLWTWVRLAYDFDHTALRAGPCIDACRAAGIQDFFFTMWGDDGAYVDFGTAFAGLAWGARRVYGGATAKSDAELEAQVMERQVHALDGTSYAAMRAASGLNANFPDHSDYLTPSVEWLWDDPILGMGWSELRFDDPARRDAMAGAWRPVAALGAQFPYPAAAAEYLLAKLDLGQRLRAAQAAGDRTAWAALADVHIPAVKARLETLAEAFRAQWLSRYKHAGLEVMQIRFAGQAARLVELARRAREVAAGAAGGLPELAASDDPRCAPRGCRYRDYASAAAL